MRTSARIAGVAAAAVLLVGGCSSDSDDGGSNDNASTSQGVTGGNNENDNGGDGGDPNGLWTNQKTGPDAVILSINDSNASLTQPGKICKGSVSGTGTLNFSFECHDGQNLSATGQVQGDSLTIDLGSGEETLKKSNLPSGIPSDLPSNIPTNIPTDLPDDIPTDLGDIPTDLPNQP